MVRCNSDYGISSYETSRRMYYDMNSGLTRNNNLSSFNSQYRRDSANVKTDIDRVEERPVYYEDEQREEVSVIPDINPENIKVCSRPHLDEEIQAEVQ
jgi:hypothetical protein